MVSRARDAEAELNLPPGFRFHPTDEELVVHYLCRKAASQHLPVPIIAELDLYKYDPWQLPEKALFGQREWYFFTPRDRKYPNGSRPNRAAGSGYWKATGADKHVIPKGCERAAGIKKALVFYAGKAPRGVKTNWIMHEYRLAGNAGGGGKGNKAGSLRLDDWVLCRLYNKKNNWQMDCPQAPEQQHQMQMQMQLQQQHSQASAASIDNSSSFDEGDGSPGIGTPESDVDNNEPYARLQQQPTNQLPATGSPHYHQLRPIKEDSNDWFMDLNLDDLNHYAFATAGGPGFGVAGAGGCAAGNPGIDTTAYQYQYQYQEPYLSNNGGLLSPVFTKTHHHMLPPF